MLRLVLFLITLGALAALVLIFIAYDLTAAVATGVVLALAGGATTVVLRLASTPPPASERGQPCTDAPDGQGVRARRSACGSQPVA